MGMPSLPVFLVALIALQTLMLFASTTTEARPSLILASEGSTSSSSISSPYPKNTYYEYERKLRSPPPPPSHSPGPTPKLKSPPSPYTSSVLRSPPPPPRYSPGPTPKLKSPPNSLHKSEPAAISDLKDLVYPKYPRNPYAASE